MAIAMLSIDYYSRTNYCIIITFSPCVKFIVLGAKFREHSAKNQKQHNISCLEFKAEHHITRHNCVKPRIVGLDLIWLR